MALSLRKITVAVALAGVAMPGISLAQDSVIEEIVVTAAKRAQTLQDIPIAVSVTSEETIEQAQIQDISDLQSVVPTLRVSQLQNSINTNFSIRGFGNGANNPGIEPSVGVFIDGVYRSRSAAAISDLPNLERVEVLSGPQSTLFGKNASAGVISVVTKKPSGEAAGQASISLGNDSAIVAKGYYENAISDNAAFSLSATHNSRDGYMTNLETGNDINNRNRQAFRGQLLLNPNDTTEIRFIADYDTIDEECCAVVNLVAGPTADAINLIGGQIVRDDPEALETYGNVDPTNELDNSGISMQIDKEFDNFTLTSITSLRNVDSVYNIDADFTSADIIENRITTDIDTFTQELRLTGSTDRLTWMVGGFYFDESIDYEDDLPFGSDYRAYLDILSQGGLSLVESILGLPVGQTFGQEGDGYTHVSTLDNQAISLFGQVDFNITDALTATVGLNYTEDEKEASSTQTRGDDFSAVDLSLFGLEVLQPVQFLPPFQNFPNPVEDGESNDDDVTYTLRLAYDLNDSVNIYGGVSTGFKATSWNLSRDARPTEQDLAALTAAGLAVPNLISGTRFAGPEESTVYELGLKARFERGALNVAIFDQRIEGFQSNVFLGTGFNLVSAGEQSTTGIEFDLTYYPTDALQLKLAGTFLDPVYDSFTQAGRDPQTGVVFDASGLTPGAIHEVSLSLSATYRFMIGSNEAFIRGDYFYEDEVPIGDASPDPVQDVSQFTQETNNLNLSAGLNLDSGLSFTAWVRNATDHESLISAFPSVAQAGSFSGYRTQPRTYGVTIAKDF